MTEVFEYYVLFGKHCMALFNIFCTAELFSIRLAKNKNDNDNKNKRKIYNSNVIQKKAYENCYRLIQSHKMSDLYHKMYTKNFKRVSQLIFKTQNSEFSGRKMHAFQDSINLGQ